MEDLREKIIFDLKQRPKGGQNGPCTFLVEENSKQKKQQRQKAMR